MVRVIILNVFCLTMIGCTKYAAIEVELAGTGFSDIEIDTAYVICGSPEASGSWRGELSMRKKFNGRIRMSGVIDLPQDRVIQCSVTGNGIQNLPFIPIYNNSLQSRHFRVAGSAKLKIRLRRKSMVLANQLYEHIEFGKIDHIANTNIKLAMMRDFMPR